MKKWITAATLAFCLLMGGCALISEPSTESGGDTTAQGSGETPSQGSGDGSVDPTHEHSFQESGRQSLSCEDNEEIYYLCDCGEKKTEVITQATGHEFEEESTTPADCTHTGSRVSRCHCGKKKTQSLPPLGHDFAATSESSSRLRPCQRGCGLGELPVEERPDRSCTYTPQTATEMEEKYEVLMAKLHESVEQDADLQRINGEFESLFNQYESALVDLGAQYQYGQFEYHQDMQSAEKAERYNGARQAYTTAVSRYYSVYQTVYESPLKDYFYEGYSQAQIDEILSYGGGESSEEILALQNANAELEMEFYSLPDPAQGNDVLSIYARLAANNNEIATLSGYDNYMEYAYAEVYGREYDYTFFNDFYGYVKTYVTPLFEQYYEAYIDLDFSTLSPTEIQEYDNMQYGSFFENVYANGKLNDFMEQVGAGSVSYGEQMEKLFFHGDYFLGEYAGAYAWEIEKEHTPIVYFGEGYREAMTVAHELGHYMNYVFGADEGSYDLKETHSQGMEMLFLYYLKDAMSAKAYDAFKTTNIYSSLATILLATSVNAFEQAIYTGSYNGLNADIIMADGQITVYEYDLLYQSIQADLGIFGKTNDYYWRYVTTLNPAYYISYAVSMSCSMQLYIKAEGSGLNRAVEAYLKTVDLTPEQTGWTYKQILEGAGLYSYEEEALYQELYNTLKRSESI